MRGHTGANLYHAVVGSGMPQIIAAYCRGTDGEKAVLQAIDTALARASQAEPAFAPEKKKKQGNVLDESYELQRSAFMAARAALKGDHSTGHEAALLLGMNQLTCWA